MANVLGDYNPTRYAQEALEQLNKVLGMAFHVHRGYDPAPSEKGDTIKIRRPGIFTAASMPISTAHSITPETLSMQLGTWEGVAFAVTDKDLAFTTEQIVTEHLSPAAVAIADSIDQDLTGLYTGVGNFVNQTGTTAAIVDLTNLKKTMFDLKVPRQGSRALMVGGQVEADLSALAVFHAADSGVDGASLQRDGYLGRKFGFDIFANQNVATHVTGTVVSGADQAGEVAGVNAVGATSIIIDTFASAETFKAGDSFTIAGDTQKYSITTDVALVTSSATVVISPALKVATAGAEVVTVRVQAKLTENMAFAPGAFALGMAPLSDLGNAAGADIGVAEDPITNITLRSRRWYEGKEAAVYWGLDALWGVKVIEPNLAVRFNS